MRVILVLVAIEAVSWQGLGVTPWLEGKPDSEWKGFSEAEWKIRSMFCGTCLLHGVMMILCLGKGWYSLRLI